jgi:hypothetical protein
MAVRRSSIFLAGAILAITFFPKPAQADEIRLKDGQKLYGVIVSYEDNMFKVKTDFGFVLVEKNKIASIVPNVTSAHNAAKLEPPASEKPAPSSTQKETRSSARSISATAPRQPPVTSAAQPHQYFRQQRRLTALHPSRMRRISRPPPSRLPLRLSLQASPPNQKKSRLQPIVKRYKATPTSITPTASKCISLLAGNYSTMRAKKSPTRSSPWAPQTNQLSWWWAPKRPKALLK